VGTYLSKLRRLKRDARLFLASLAFQSFAIFGLYGVLFNLFLLRLGYGPDFIGLVNGLFMLVYGLFSLAGGALGGRWGTRRTMSVGMALAVIAMTLIPFADLVPKGRQAPWIVGTQVFLGLSASLYLVNGIPFLVETTDLEERSYAFSLLTALQPLGASVGGLVAGLLPGLFAALLGTSMDDPAPYGYPLWCAAGFFGLALLALLLARGDEGGCQDRPDSAPDALPADRGPAPYGLMIMLALVFLLFQAALAGVRDFFNVYLDTQLQAPTSLIGILMSGARLLATPVALATPMLVERWGTGWTMLRGCLGAVLVLLLFALVPHWTVAGLGFLGMAAMNSMTNPAFDLYHQGIVAPRWRGAMSGVRMASMQVGRSASVLGGGFIITALGFRSFYLIGAGLAAASALLFWAYFRVPRGEYARQKLPKAS
jgi:MFS family permease